ncbi:MAG TPA: hypothetical protein VMZ22_10240 [Acidimicrobiales bacterium]|nr:hypothetical protein [Acidimicrobiales bacterium]
MNPPKLATGLEVVPLVDGVAVVNGGSPALFQGRAATELLVPLLVALDGVLNAEGLAAALGVAEAHVTRGLQLLGERGLLEAD